MLLCCACLLARTRRAHSANKRALARSKDIEGLARRAIVSYFTREEERRSRSTQIMMKLELISCQASSDATAQLSSETSRTVLDLFTGLPLVNSSLKVLPLPYLFSLVTAPWVHPTRQSTTLRPLGYFPIDLGTIYILDRYCQMI